MQPTAPQLQFNSEPFYVVRTTDHGMQYQELIPAQSYILVDPQQAPIAVPQNGQYNVNVAPQHVPHIVHQIGQQYMHLHGVGTPHHPTNMVQLNGQYYANGMLQQQALVYVPQNVQYNGHAASGLGMVRNTHSNVNTPSGQVAQYPCYVVSDQSVTPSAQFSSYGMVEQPSNSSAQFPTYGMVEQPSNSSVQFQNVQIIPCSPNVTEQPVMDCKLSPMESCSPSVSTSPTPSDMSDDTDGPTNSTAGYVYYTHATNYCQPDSRTARFLSKDISLSLIATCETEAGHLNIYHMYKNGEVVGSWLEDYGANGYFQSAQYNPKKISKDFFFKDHRKQYTIVGCFMNLPNGLNLKFQINFGAGEGKGQGMEARNFAIKRMERLHRFSDNKEIALVADGALRARYASIEPNYAKWARPLPKKDNVIELSLNGLDKDLKIKDVKNLMQVTLGFKLKHVALPMEKKNQSYEKFQAYKQSGYSKHQEFFLKERVPNTGYAFIKFKNVEDAVTALTIFDLPEFKSEFGDVKLRWSNHMSE